ASGPDRGAARQHSLGAACPHRQVDRRLEAARHKRRRGNRRNFRGREGVTRMASSISANKAELLAIANSVASEKMIDKAIVIEAMEEAIQKSARNRYGAENDIRAKLDPVTGDLRLWRVVEVVEEVEDYFKQVDLEQAQKLQEGAQMGDFIVDPLPPVDLGRIDAQSAKQVIFQKVRDAERERQFEEFKDRANEVITGVIKSVEF